MAALACFGQEAGNGTGKEEVVGMVGTGRVEKLGSKDSGARAWTPATRSAKAMLRQASGVVRLRLRGRIEVPYWGGDREKGPCEIRWTGSAGKVVRRDRLGSLLSFYCREAA